MVHLGQWKWSKIWAHSEGKCTRIVITKYVNIVEISSYRRTLVSQHYGRNLNVPILFYYRAKESTQINIITLLCRRACALCLQAAMHCLTADLFWMSAVWHACKKNKRWNQNQSWNKTSLKQFEIDMISLKKCNINTVFWLFASWISFPKGSPTIKSENWSTTYHKQDQFAVQPYNSNRNNDIIFVQNKVIY